MSDPLLEQNKTANTGAGTWTAISAEHTFLLVQGPDALKFLQGQLTCDVNALKSHQALIGGHCTPKGRMISSFVLGARDEDHVWLRVRSNLLDIAFAALQKYAVFSKVTLDKPAYLCLSLGEAAYQTLNLPSLEENQTAPWGASCLAVRRPGTQELWGPAAEIQALAQEADGLNMASLSQPELESLWIAAGHADIQAETTEAFLPQMLNYDALGGISYKKGCYTGQEIIARMHYKGQAKKHGYRIELAQSRADDRGLSVGQPLYSEEDLKQSTATVLAVGQNDAFVVANDTLNGERKLFTESSPIEIRWHDLPYAIPK